MRALLFGEFPNSNPANLLRLGAALVLIGIFLLKDPLPGSPRAWRTLFGCVLAMVGGLLLGNLQ